MSAAPINPPRAVAVRKRKSAEMSTTRGWVPDCSAAVSSLSIMAADTPCGAAENTAVTGLAVTYSMTSS